MGVCTCGFCNAWVCIHVFVGCLICGCFDHCEGVLVLCVLGFTVFFFYFMYIHYYLLL